MDETGKSPAGASRPEVKITAKDSVFRDLFGDRRYALELYKAIHPEDTGVTEADIGSVTIHNVFVDQEYNDLGMTVRETLLVLLEAQSTWSVNILIRILMYLAQTWKEYIEETHQNRYGSKKLCLPRPELYVIYTGDPENKPEWLQLSKEFFDGNADFLEVKVKVLYGSNNGDIISQYVGFTAVYNEQMKRLGRTREAVLETIRICKDRNLLKEYMERREKEVVSIMMSLFDQEQIMKQYGYEKMMEARIKTRKEDALRLKKRGLADDWIAETLEIDPKTLAQWFAEENEGALLQ